MRSARSSQESAAGLPCSWLKRLAQRSVKAARALMIANIGIKALDLAANCTLIFGPRVCNPFDEIGKLIDMTVVVRRQPDQIVIP